MENKLQKRTVFIYKAIKILQKNKLYVTDPTDKTDPTNGTITVTTILKTI